MRVRGEEGSEENRAKGASTLDLLSMSPWTLVCSKVKWRGCVCLSIRQGCKATSP